MAVSYKWIDVFVLQTNKRKKKTIRFRLYFSPLYQSKPVYFFSFDFCYFRSQFDFVLSLNFYPLSPTQFRLFQNGLFVLFCFVFFFAIQINIFFTLCRWTLSFVVCVSSFRFGLIWFCSVWISNDFFFISFFFCTGLVVVFHSVSYWNNRIVVVAVVYEHSTCITQTQECL